VVGTAGLATRATLPVGQAAGVCRGGWDRRSGDPRRAYGDPQDRAHRVRTPNPRAQRARHRLCRARVMLREHSAAEQAVEQTLLHRAQHLAGQVCAHGDGGEE